MIKSIKIDLKVYDKFKIKTMKDYQDFYFNCDILSLADLFEKISNKCLKNYDLCTSLYLSVHTLSWDPILGKTNVELYVISDFDM